MAWYNRKKTEESIPAEQKASKTTSLKVLSMGTSSWPERNYENFAKEAYLKNVVAYRCITEIAQSVSSVSWCVYKSNKEGDRVELDNHPLLKILRRANPDESFQDFMLNINASVEGQFISGTTLITPRGPLIKIPRNPSSIAVLTSTY